MQFNPYPIQPWLARQERLNPDINQTILNPINQGLGTLVEWQKDKVVQSRQKAMDQLLREKYETEKRQSDYQYGAPIDPNVNVGIPTGNAARSSFMPTGMGQVATQSPLIEQFNQWRAGGLKPEGARAEFMPALGIDERSIFQRNANPKTVSEEDLDLKRARADYLDRTANKPSPVNFNQENKLRSEFLSQSKDFSDTASAYQRMVDSSREPSAAGDLALIFNYMKMLDPGSTVREGEFANAAASGSYGARFQAAAQKITSGQRLDDSMRTDFMSRATDLYQGQLSRHKQREGEFQNLGKSYGGDPSRITPNLATPVGGYGQPNNSGGLMWNGRPLKDTPANRAWLQSQGGGQ